MLHIKHLAQALARLNDHAREHLSRRDQAARAALEQLRRAPAPEVLRTRIRQAPSEWAGAVPVDETPLAEILTAATPPPAGAVVLGVDGSQILPDRHAPVQYYVLQVGCLRFCYDGSTPVESGYAELHYEEAELYDEHDLLIGARVLGLKRLVLEMTYLAEQVEAARQAYPAAPAIYALTDGPLLWSSYGEEGRTVQKLFELYMAAFHKIQQAGGVPVGYVERPSGAYLLKLLSLPPTDEEEFAPPAPPYVSPDHLRDADVMARHLPAGGRTPWFQRMAPANREHQAQGQAIVACYVNAGTNYPVIARVEVPLWALDQTERLFGVLHHQNALLHYPYVLARAHELAVITSEDKAALEQAMQSALWSHGFRPSEKARTKLTLARRS